MHVRRAHYSWKRRPRLTHDNHISLSHQSTSCQLVLALLLHPQVSALVAAVASDMRLCRSTRSQELPPVAISKPFISLLQASVVCASTSIEQSRASFAYCVFMASSWDAQSLEAIPESATVSYQPGSAHPSPSPRSTSDNPARSPSSQPISQHSRLLQPTLSWQAKAAWLPDPVADASTSVMDHGFVDNITQVQVSTAALTARNQALAAGRRTSLISPSTSFRARDAVRMSAHDTRGEHMYNATNVSWSCTV